MPRPFNWIRGEGTVKNQRWGLGDDTTTLDLTSLYPVPSSSYSPTLAPSTSYTPSVGITGSSNTSTLLLVGSAIGLIFFLSRK
jgi:hypothetical protein